MPKNFFDPTTFEQSSAPLIGIYHSDDGKPLKPIAIISTTQPDLDGNFTIKYLQVTDITGNDDGTWDCADVIVSGRNLYWNDRFLNIAKRIIDGTDDEYDERNQQTSYKPAFLTLNNNSRKVIEIPTDGRYYIKRMFDGKCPFIPCVDHFVCPGCTGGRIGDLRMGCGVSIRCPVCMGYDEAERDRDFYKQYYCDDPPTDEDEENERDVEKSLESWKTDMQGSN